MHSCVHKPQFLYCFLSVSLQEAHVCFSRLFHDRARMEPREPNSHAEQTEGKLRELASKWFIETQVPLIVHNGFFPTWFLGFITRNSSLSFYRDAEEILRLKEQGCFLVRLSKKAIGYILSYKGKDRFRHFVINQSEKGQFVVCGDCEAHDTMPDLIQYYNHLPGASPGWVEGSTAQHQTVSQCCPPGSVYYKLSLLESSKRRSLPLPDNSSDGEHYHKLSAPPHTPPRLSPTPIRQVPRMEKTDSCSSPGSRDHLGDSAVYHLAGKHGIPHTAPSGTSSGTLVKHSDSVYAEVPSEAPFSRLSRGNTYELIPGREDSVHLKPKSNTYELLEDVRPKVIKISNIYNML
uniref:SH2 domain containing 7 n=1 Tax=Scophthalmus maximus TaxID=52904 RepID=A0A8D3AYK8_SCOMX